MKFILLSYENYHNIKDINKCIPKIIESDDIVSIYKSQGISETPSRIFPGQGIGARVFWGNDGNLCCLVELSKRFHFYNYTESLPSPDIDRLTKEYTRMCSDIKQYVRYNQIENILT